MKAKAVLRLKFTSKKHLDIFIKALEPEVKKPATTRSKANIERRNKFLILRVEAKDTVALRATLNAFLRWINSVTNVLEVLEKP
ncbi:MAG: KEOPS complex subunit Pcc1 [Candidatus Bathycorpusculaceae bacterium]